MKKKIEDTILDAYKFDNPYVNGDLFKAKANVLKNNAFGAEEMLLNSYNTGAGEINNRFARSRDSAYYQGALMNKERNQLLGNYGLGGAYYDQAKSSLGTMQNTLANAYVGNRINSLSDDEFKAVQSLRNQIVNEQLNISAKLHSDLDKLRGEYDNNVYNTQQRYLTSFTEKGLDEKGKQTYPGVGKAQDFLMRYGDSVDDEVADAARDTLGSHFKRILESTEFKSQSDVENLIGQFVRDPKSKEYLTNLAKNNAKTKGLFENTGTVTEAEKAVKKYGTDVKAKWIDRAGWDKVMIDGIAYDKQGYNIFDRSGWAKREEVNPKYNYAKLSLNGYNKLPTEVKNLYTSVFGIDEKLIRQIDTAYKYDTSKGVNMMKELNDKFEKLNDRVFKSGDKYYMLHIDKGAAGKTNTPRFFEIKGYKG